MKLKTVAELWPTKPFDIISVPCVVYAEGGRELVTSNSEQSNELTAGTVFFSPQGFNLSS